MHVPLRAGARRRTRRALLAAALPAALAALALPSAAPAGTVSLTSGNLFYDGAGSEKNDISVHVVGSGTEIRISDAAGISSSSSACQVVNLVDAFCPVNVSFVTILTQGGDDRVEYRVPHPGFVDLGAGVDTLVAGTREAAGRTIQPVRYLGGSGHDEISYVKADRGVSLTPEDNTANDGRPGDAENVFPDFETIKGSNFRDAPLFGTPNNDIMIGNGGNDQIAGGFGNDVFVSSGLDGADDYHGGPGTDAISYFGRTRQLLIDLDNVNDDGELGENDNVRSNVENVSGGSGNDVIKSLGAHSRLEGNGGADTLLGGSGPDTLIGGTGVDSLEGGTDSDVILARDGEQDTVICGTGVDTVTADLASPTDLMTGCENVSVGTLRLAPKAVEASAGEPAHVRLSWRHPRAWRNVRSIELRLYRDGAPVGEVTVRPRTERISADGGVRLMRRHTRLTHNGKTVTARLAVRLDDSLAGASLTAEVEATDTRGARQLEPNAAKLRVAH